MKDFLIEGGSNKEKRLRYISGEMVNHKEETASPRIVEGGPNIH